jgi:hypothetical protein
MASPCADGDGLVESQMRQQHGQLMLTRPAQGRLLYNLWINRAVLDGQVQHRH